MLTEAHPKKTPPKKVEAEITSTHKARVAWFSAREAWPLREAPIELVLQARAQASTDVPAAPGTAEWGEAGPSNIGGRMTSIVVHPNDSARLLVGAAGGGGLEIPAAVGAILLGQGKLKGKGVLPPEACVDPKEFIDVVKPLMDMTEQRDGKAPESSIIFEHVDGKGKVTVLDF